MQLPIWLILVLAAIAYGLFWCLVCLMISWASGWSKLALEYQIGEMPEGRIFRWQSLRLRSVGYNNCMTIGVTDEGLYIAALPLFRPGHPRLLIDWEAIGTFETSKFLWLTIYATAIQLDRQDDISLKFTNRKIVQEIEARRGEPGYAPL